MPHDSDQQSKPPPEERGVHPVRPDDGDGRRFAAAIADSIRDGLLVLAPDLRVEVANAAFRRAFHLAPEDVEGRLVFDLGDGQWDIPALRELLERTAPARGAVAACEVTRRFEGAGERTLHLRARRLEPGSRILLVIEDLTGHQQDARAVREARDLLALATSAADLGWGTWDFTTGAASWDARGREIVGFASDAEAGTAEGWLARLHPDDRAAVEAEVAACLAERREFSHEYRVVRADGQVRHIEAYGRFLQAEDGTPLWGTGLVRDVTERRRAEEALRRASRRDAFRVELGDALRSLTDPVAVQEAAARLLGDYLRVARAFYAEVEPDGEHVLVARDYRAAGVASVVGRHHLNSFGPALVGELRAGRTLAVADVVAEEGLSEDERSAYRAIGVQAFAGVPLVKGARFVAAFGVHQSAPRRWTEEEVELIEEIAERTWAAVERARAEEALRQLNETLEQRVAQRTREVLELASSLSVAEQQERGRIAQVLHDDIQQLLYSLHIRLGLLRDSRDPESVAERLADTGEILRRAIATTRSLTVEMNPPVLREEGLDRSLRWLASHMREAYRLRVELDLDEASLDGVGDSERVLVFHSARELLFNTVKHAGVDRARLAAAREGGRLRVWVTDEGAGFDPQEVLQRPGSGFGLRTIRERLRLFGGDLRVEATPGGGSRLGIELPLAGAAPRSTPGSEGD